MGTSSTENSNSNNETTTNNGKATPVTAAPTPLASADNHNNTVTTVTTEAKDIINPSPVSMSSSTENNMTLANQSCNGHTANKDAVKLQLATTHTTQTTATAATTPAMEATQNDHEMPDAPEQEEQDQQQRRSKRRSSSRSRHNIDNDTTSTATTTTSTATTKKSKTELSHSKKEQELLDMSWICTACRQAECAMDTDSDLVVCEGPCRRLFHFACAGLAQAPFNESVWQCHDCVSHRHVCAVCQEYGVDNDDLFKCQKATCGWFFHEACLQMQTIGHSIQHVAVAVDGDSAANGTDTGNSVAENTTVPESPNTPSTTASTPADGEINGSPQQPQQQQQRVLKFTCPAHWCWTCTQDDLKHESAAAAATEAAAKTANKSNKKKKASANSNNSNTNAFAAKREKRLFPCLNCPTSYHLTCIPPMAKFHELALLCHDHAATNELPLLDMDTSFQGSVEASVDQKLHKVQHQENLLANRRSKQLQSANKLGGRRGLTCKNPFFPPRVVADRRTSREQMLQSKFVATIHLEMDDNNATQNNIHNNTRVTVATTNMVACATSNHDRLLFCLPTDLQEEVHSKPPPYKHIHSLKYYPENRPKKIPIPHDICNCVDSCGEDCLNRLLYVECFGNNNQGGGGNTSASQNNNNNNTNSNNTTTKVGGTNCRVGPNCGNRRLGQRQCVKKCKPQREKGRGWGLVTLESVPKGSLVQEYLGDVINETTKEERLKEWSREHPNDTNFYIMCLSQGWYIDAREQSNLARFINHSCDPNCILLRFNVGGFMRDGIFALRDIQPGEFLSYDYHFDTKRGDQFICRCGSANCRGTMKETILKKEAAKKTRAQLWDTAKQQLEKDREFLEDVEAKQKWNATIRAVLPGTGTGTAAENPDGSSQKTEWVSTGVQDKDRLFAIRNRVFLWRNAVQGSDFSSRWDRYMVIAKDPENRGEGTSSSNSGQQQQQQHIRRKKQRTRNASSNSTPRPTVDVISVLIAGNKK